MNMLVLQVVMIEYNMQNKPAPLICGLYQPLPNTERPSEEISMGCHNHFYLELKEKVVMTIFVVVDQFSKMSQFIPCNTLDASRLLVYFSRR